MIASSVCSGEAGWRRRPRPAGVDRSPDLRAGVDVIEAVVDHASPPCRGTPVEVARVAASFLSGAALLAGGRWPAVEGGGPRGR
ncbi:MAG TPA: hypothetical protein VFD49_19950 [Candidatus Dormibacteraeota bacterium]|nr:hypothetical protein [Candidatus Dormibacteraeota bacterium]